MQDLQKPNPSLPYAVTKGMTNQAALALTGLPSPPHHKNFLISLRTLMIQEIKNMQQEVMYHIVAKST